MPDQTLYILYNADASVMGKLKYGYKKMRHSTEENPACAACDITHGGLSLNESPAWVEAKKEIESQSGCKVVQWHRDELSAEMKKFVTEKELRYPAVVVDRGADQGGLGEVMNSSELGACKGDPQKLIAGLKEKGMMGAQTTASAAL